MRKKVLSILLVLTMVLTLTPTVAFAATYGDTNGHWAESSIDRWSNVGVVHGTGAGEFNPNGDMSRAEAAQTFANLLRLKETTSISGYSDVDASAWYVDAVSKCVAAGILNGTGGNTMSPGRTVTREQTFVMIARALGVEDQPSSNKTFADAGSVSSWAVGSVNALVNLGVIQGIDASNIGPKVDINRASVMTVMDRLIGTYANTDGEWPIASKGITLVVAEDVSLTGTATDLPVVLAGDTAKVDMSNVTGAAKVVVQADTVDITGAPEGTEFVTENAGNVTVNGDKVDNGQDYVVPENKPGNNDNQNKPQGGSGGTSGGGYRDNITEETINGIIENGIEEVNKKIEGNTTNPQYAVLEKLSKDNEGNNVVNVTIYDGTVNVSTVKTDILDILINALQENNKTVSKITAIKALDGTTIQDTENAVLSLKEEITEDKVLGFVKALVPSVESGTNIEALKDKSFEVQVTDTENGKGQTNVNYEVKFQLASLDQYIQWKVPSVNEKIEDYASISFKDNTLEVIVNDHTVKVAEVYKNIGILLRDSLQARISDIKLIEGNGDENNKIDFENKHTIDMADIETFVKGLKFGTLPDGTTITGQTTIGDLVGKPTTFNVYFTDDKKVMYTVRFTNGTLQNAMVALAKHFNEDANTGSLAQLIATDKKLTVDILDGDKRVRDIYTLIGTPLAETLKQHSDTIRTITGVSIGTEILNGQSSNNVKVENKKVILTVNNNITEKDIYTFVKNLMFSRGKYPIIDGGWQLRYLKGNSLEFEVDTKAEKDPDNLDEGTYTVVFK